MKSLVDPLPILFRHACNAQEPAHTRRQEKAQRERAGILAAYTIDTIRTQAVTVDLAVATEAPPAKAA